MRDYEEFNNLCYRVNQILRYSSFLAVRDVSFEIGIRVGQLNLFLRRQFDALGLNLCRFIAERLGIWATNKMPNAQTNRSPMARSGYHPNSHSQVSNPTTKATSPGASPPTKWMPFETKQIQPVAVRPDEKQQAQMNSQQIKLKAQPTQQSQKVNESAQPAKQTHKVNEIAQPAKQTQEVNEIAQPPANQTQKANGNAQPAKQVQETEKLHQQVQPEALQIHQQAQLKAEQSQQIKRKAQLDAQKTQQPPYSQQKAQPPQPVKQNICPPSTLTPICQENKNNIQDRRSPQKPPSLGQNMCRRSTPLPIKRPASVPCNASVTPPPLKMSKCLSVDESSSSRIDEVIDAAKASGMFTSEAPPGVIQNSTACAVNEAGLQLFCLNRDPEQVRRLALQLLASSSSYVTDQRDKLKVEVERLKRESIEANVKSQNEISQLEKQLRVMATEHSVVTTELKEKHEEARALLKKALDTVKTGEETIQISSKELLEKSKEIENLNEKIKIMKESNTREMRQMRNLPATIQLFVEECLQEVYPVTPNGVIVKQEETGN